MGKNAPKGTLHPTPTVIGKSGGKVGAATIPGGKGK
jgi:hypothetical protein